MPSEKNKKWAGVETCPYNILIMLLLHILWSEQGFTYYAVVFFVVHFCRKIKRKFVESAQRKKVSKNL